MKSDGSFSCMFFFFFFADSEMHRGRRRKAAFCAFYCAERVDSLISYYLHISIYRKQHMQEQCKRARSRSTAQNKKKIIKLINIMLIYRYMYTVLSPRSMGCHSRVFSLPFHRVNASHANHHVCNFTLKETYHAFFFPLLCFISVREHVKVHGSSSLIQKTLLLMCLKCLVSSSAFNPKIL